MVPLDDGGTVNLGEPTLNTFQERLAQRLEAALARWGCRIDVRRAGWEEAASPSGRPEAVLHVAAQALEVRIREDSVGFTLSGRDDYYELVDYSDADALADAFLAAVTRQWKKQQ